MKQLKLGVFLRAFGHHVAAWRHPDTPLEADVNFAYYAKLARIAERGLLDMLFLADNSSIPDEDIEIVGRMSHSLRIDPFPLMAALAAVTEHVGLVCTSTTTYNHPYSLARRFAALDHISGGRSGWNLVTSGNRAEAYNFGFDEHPAHAERYKRAREFARIARGLWDCWDDDAFPRDKATGVFFDPEKMHRLNHVGAYYQVRGPLNIARCPQGQPVLVQAGSSEDGKNLAAETADVVFTAHPTLQAAQSFYADVKARAVRYGRDPDSIVIMPGILVTVGATTEDARMKYDRLQDLIDPKVGLNLLSHFMGFDLSSYPVDGPLPEVPDTLAAHSRPALLAEMARRDKLTIRQLYLQIAGGRGHAQIVGSAAKVADLMEEWLVNGAADGFNVLPPLLPGALEDFVTLVVPELQRRGLFRREYEGRTLRDRLGLPIPKPTNRAEGAALKGG